MAQLSKGTKPDAILKLLHVLIQVHQKMYQESMKNTEILNDITDKVVSRTSSKRKIENEKEETNGVSTGIINDMDTEDNLFR